MCSQGQLADAVFNRVYRYSIALYLRQNTGAMRLELVLREQPLAKHPVETLETFCYG